MPTLWDRLADCSSLSNARESAVNIVVPKTVRRILVGALCAVLLAVPGRSHAADDVKPPPAPVVVFPKQPRLALPPQPKVVAPVTKRCPRVLGLSRTQARQVIERRGLRVARIDTKVSSNPVDTVIAQNPGPDQPAIKNTVCDIVVAEAPPPITVPDLANMTPDKASAWLNDARFHGRLRLGRVTNVAFHTPVGRVFAQRPGAGTRVKTRAVIDVWVARPMPPLIVPDLTGLTRTKARDRLDRTTRAYELERRQDVAKAGLTDAPVIPRLRLGGVQSQVAAKPANTVIRQSPAPRTPVRRSTQVNIVLAKAVPPPAPVEIPDLAGLTEDQARASLGNKRYRGLLALGQVALRESKKPAGKVFQQAPAPGTAVRERTQVDIVLAKAAPPPAPVEIPDLAGLTEEQARARLGSKRNRGLLVLGQVTIRESKNPTGKVFLQSPAPGTAVRERTRVDIVLAKAVPPPPPVEIPDLAGLTEDQARARLGNKRYRGLLALGQVTIRESKKPTGKVFQQSPAPGTAVRERTRVDIVLAKAVPPPARPVEVPDLAGLTEDQARARLGNKRYRGLLALGQVTIRESKKPAGKVFQQAPAAGTAVRERTRVDIVLAKAVPPPAPVEIPDLAGLTEDQAKARLDGVGLVLGRSTSRDSDRASGTVMAQSPAAGTRVGPGTHVDVVFAKKATPITKYVPVIAGGGAAALIAAGFTWWRRRSHHDAREAHRPDMRLFPVVDGGEQEIEIDPAGPAAPPVGLRPRRDPGTQTLIVEDPNDDDDASA